ncbi:hypothetical protein OPKNFCMD_3156 [Methylobacterium crusticola]|uniref:Uncharacterized protein n=1 Tax=Methylobacterium crusticola TaxID=1697972 RepID=A0ABQ4QZ08_9HYPH|nr:hypothetical protein [Methylobacterium crusticola]GJD50417.1 hypothetical protein OPKNFCMD_3156 [Methylobacterium crusticola]
MEDTLELRERLTRAWRAVLDNAVDGGSPPDAVVETMAAVAHARFAELFGAPAAASYLALLAEQMREVDHDEAASLIRGEAPPAAPETEAEPLIDPAWIDRDGPI